jgi:peptide/nickel transport system substrate-binding protein
MTRRALLAGVVAAGASRLAGSSALAHGRLPVGGRVSMHVPWPVAAIDPQRIDDVAAAIFAEGLFDTLYARDDTDAIVPLLAESDPVAQNGVLRVALRTKVRFASGRGLDARTVAQALARARSLGAAGWLADVPAPRIDGPDAITFAMHDAQRLVQALASPLTAIVPSRFQPEHPDGTGAFRADRRGDALVLAKNPIAARGPAFLDEIVVRSADRETSLREFEGGADDIGWLGTGRYEPRRGSLAFDAGAVAFVILRAGHEAGARESPGEAQALANALPNSALRPLGVGLPWEESGSPDWEGPPCDLLVRDDAPWLMDLAKLVAPLMSAKSKVTPAPVAAAEFAQRRASRAFAFALDIARPVTHGGLGTLIGLATADDPATAASLARHPPRGGDLSPRTVTRTMRIGVVAEVRVQGGRVPDLFLPASSAAFGVDFGAATRGRRES